MPGREKGRKISDFLRAVGCYAVAVAPLSFYLSSFHPGRRSSHHAHQFALRYKLRDRLYPDYGVTRYRGFRMRWNTHADVDPPLLGRVPVRSSSCTRAYTYTIRIMYTENRYTHTRIHMHTEVCV